MFVCFAHATLSVRDGPHFCRLGSSGFRFVRCGNNKHFFLQLGAASHECKEGGGTPGFIRHDVFLLFAAGENEFHCSPSTSRNQIVRILFGEYSVRQFS